ncbi:hypothetical protein D3C75_617310 [compost metagenome]
MVASETFVLLEPGGFNPALDIRGKPGGGFHNQFVDALLKILHPKQFSSHCQHLFLRL